MATKSKLGSLNFNDIFKGLLIAVSSSVLMAAKQMLLSVPAKLDLDQISLVASIAAIAYIGKQLSQNSDGDLFTKENQ